MGATTDSQHARRKRSNDSLYAISDPGYTEKRKMVTVPTTEELVLRVDQEDHLVCRHHGVTLDPSVTAHTRDVSSVMQTPSLPSKHEHGNTEVSLSSNLGSPKASEGRHSREVQATGIAYGTAPRNRISRTFSTDQDTITED